MKTLRSAFLLVPLLIFSLPGCSDKIADAPEPARHFVGVERTDLHHKLLVKYLRLERERIPSGWEIGICTWDGVVSGTGIWDADSGTVITVYGADEESPQFYAGQYFDARLWDPENGREFYADVTVKLGPEVWSANGFSEVSIDGYNIREQRVQLTAGWNLVSINIMPLKTMFRRIEGPDVMRMTSQMGVGAESNLALFITERGLFYVPSRDYNGIPYWNLTEGYKLNVKEPFECVWVGRELSYNENNIVLARGWNMVAYLKEYPLSCDSLGFRAISYHRSTTEIEIAKDEAGRFAIPSYNFSNMIPWREGKGYQINVSEEITYWHYPDSEDVAPTINILDTLSIFGPWTMPKSTGSNMSVLVNEFRGVVPVNGDAVAAFSSRNRLVGLGHVGAGRAGLAVWGDDEATNAVDGLSSGESFMLKYWKASSNEIDTIYTSTISGDGTRYVSDGFSILLALIQP